jgi:hypothetical protein
MFRSFFIIMTLSVIFLACKQTKQDDLLTIANQFADRECKAIHFREERFQLANNIRFTEDTLRQTKSADSSRLKQKLQQLNNEKQTILQKSLLLADTIHKQLDGLMANELKDKNRKEKFNALLNAELEKRGCK